MGKMLDKVKGMLMPEKKDRPQEEQLPGEMAASATDKQAQHKRKGAIVYICKACGGHLMVDKSRSFPAFLMKKFICRKCGRRTDEYIEERKEIVL